MLAIKDIKTQIKLYNKELITIRRHLHANPELSYKEFKTVAYVKSLLNDWGIQFKSCTPTGLVAIIKSKKPSKKVIALRADMDALPIEEKTKLTFKSKNKGVMHACGHDIHTTCLLGAIYALHKTRHQWEGTIKCIFQPGEEQSPGGASLMIKEGVLHKSPIPKAILGLHILPSLPVGKVAFNHGKIMASADEIYITVYSKGGHAAAPHLTTDSIYIASKIVIDLQELISRRRNPLIPSVLSVCAFNGGDATNIIPSKVELKGTFRSLDEDWRWKAHQLIKQYIKGLNQSTGTKIKIDISIGYPCVVNDKKIYDLARKYAIDVVGAQNVLEQQVRLGGEDFGFYSQHIPACFFRLGTGTLEHIKKGTEPYLHTSYLNVNEKAIPIGATSMAWIASQLLKSI